MTTLSKEKKQLDLLPWELQTLTQMLGSRKALQTYLGMERKEFDTYWAANNLLAPTEKVRRTTTEVLTSEVILRGSTRAAAEFMGVSDSFLKTLLKERLGLTTKAASSSADEIERSVKRYGSVKFASRVMGLPDAIVRKVVKDRKLEKHLSYEISDHNNGKGRRAELYWAELEGDKILKDMNIEDGSQAPYDFEHSTYGRVNVKSSSAHRYRAKSRSGNPTYWKFSIKGHEAADHFAFVCYDDKHRNPMHVHVEKTGTWMLGKNSITAKLENNVLKLQAE